MAKKVSKNMAKTSVPAKTKIPKAQEQHMLLLFVPIDPKKLKPKGTAPLEKLFASMAASDNRADTGVHFFMTHLMLPGAKARIPVPTFQPAPTGPNGVEKAVLVVLSIYDADFEPYISAFFADPVIVFGLNYLLTLMDESGIVPDTDTSSAVYIRKHEGVVKNAASFYKLLMRYNFADPTIPGVGPGGMVNPLKDPPYFLGATFPGLTVGMILKSKTGYPDAVDIWPAPGAAPEIDYEPSTPPLKR
jgi:hypothetical protein